MTKKIRTHIRDEKLVISRRDHIARHAARIFVKQGYDKTTTREIARECNMTMGTLYRYVGSKEDILYLVMDQDLSAVANYFDEVIADVGELSPLEAIKRAIEEFYRRVDTVQDFGILFYQEAKSLSPRARKSVMEAEKGIVDAFEKILIRGHEAGDFTVDNSKLVAHDIVVAGEMWAVRRWFLRECCTLDEYIKREIEWVLKGISAI